MGLAVAATGLSPENSIDSGHISFMGYRIAVAKAYNAEFGRICEKWYKSAGIGPPLTEAESRRWNEICDDNLDIFLTRSDCGGKFSPQECRKIYNALKPLKVDMPGHNYGVEGTYDLHSRWLSIFKHCADRRVILRFY